MLTFPTKRFLIHSPIGKVTKKQEQTAKGLQSPELPSARKSQVDFSLYPPKLINLLWQF